MKPLLVDAVGGDDTKLASKLYIHLFQLKLRLPKDSFE
jgi:hypothetical protein